MSITFRVALQPMSAFASVPQYATSGSAGLDLPAAIAEPIVIAPGDIALIPCGFAIALPEGYEAQVRPRSGLAIRQGLTVLNAPGTVDADYRGEVKVILINHGKEPVTITPAMRIAQMVVAPVVRVEWELVRELPDSARRDGGFGHSGQ